MVRDHKTRDRGALPVVQAGAKGGLDKHPRCSTRALRALRACRVGLLTGCPGERERDDVARQSRPIPAGVSCACLGMHVNLTRYLPSSSLSPPVGTRQTQPAPAHVRHRIRLTGLTAGPHQRSPVQCLLHQDSSPRVRLLLLLAERLVMLFSFLVPDPHKCLTIERKSSEDRRLVTCPNSLHRRRAVPSGEDAIDRGLIKRWFGLNRTHRCQLKPQT